MRRFIRSSAVALATAIALGFILAPPAGAQNIASLYHVTPADAGAFEAALAEHVAHRIEQGDPWGWTVMQVVSGEDLGDFIYRSGSHEWADFDAYDEGFGGEAGQHYQETVAPHVADTRQWMTVTDTANSRWPAEWDDIHLIGVTRYHLEPGMQEQFDEIIGTIHGAIVDADWPIYYSWAYMAAGTGGPQRTLAVFHENWADFEQPDTPFMEMLQEQLGEDETKNVMERFGETYRYIENMVLRVRMDLAVPPASQNDN